MNKRAQKLGLIAIVLTLLVGCTNASPDSGGGDESNDLGKEISLEANYEMKTNEEIEITQDYGVFQVDNETPYQELITKTVDIHTFAQYFHMYGYNRGIDDVMEVIGVECLRETPMDTLYSVHKVEQGGLLYIFYHNDDPEAEIRTNEIRQWFYVPKRIKYTEISKLKGKGATIEDVIKIDKADQIFLNCYRADPMYQGEEGVLTTYHFCEGGILETTYYWIHGEFVCAPSTMPNYFLSDIKISNYDIYDTRILAMDWVE